MAEYAKWLPSNPVVRPQNRSMAGCLKVRGGRRQMIFLAAKGAPAQAEVGQAAAQPVLPHQMRHQTWIFSTSPSI